MRVNLQTTKSIAWPHNDVGDIADDADFPQLDELELEFIAGLDKNSVIKLWTSARHPNGDALRLVEVEPLAARWLELFGEPPTTLPGRQLPGKTPNRLGPETNATADTDTFTGSLLTRRQVAERLNISTSTLSRRVKAGKFPRPVRVGKRRVMWPEADLARWLATNAVQPQTR